MTNEQLTQEFIKLAEQQAKYDAERENMLQIIEEIKEDVKTTKSLAEDVHILALNMENMQKTVDETKKTVDNLNLKEYNDFKESKKLVKQNISSAIIGAIIAFILSFVAWIIRFYILKGG